MVYEHSEEVRDEISEAYCDMPIFKARIEFEKLVLGQKKLSGVVVRPGWVYGGSGGYTTTWFDEGKKDKIIIRGKKDKKWSFVHVTDLADAFVRIGKANSEIVKGQIFNIGEGALSYEDFVVQCAKIAGFHGLVEYAESDPNDFISTKMDRSVIIHSQKAKNLLGWNHNHPPFLEELQIYFDAIKANLTTLP